jgi:sulfoxide reductase heme-binding subunit YedZ
VEENAKATVDNARAGEAVSIDDPGATALHKTAATAGFLAYGLMVGTLAWGMLTTTGLARRSIRRQTLYGGHMTMSIMTLSFMLVHVLANVFNPRGALSASSALVPLAGAQPFGVSLGVISAELLVAVAVSIGFQRIVSYRRWHSFHRLAYPAFALALLHTFISGSDVRNGLIATGLIASLLALVALFVFRAVPSTSLVRARFAPVES